MKQRPTNQPIIEIYLKGYEALENQFFLLTNTTVASKNKVLILRLSLSHKTITTKVGWISLVQQY